MKKSPEALYHREVVVRMAGPAQLVFKLFRLLCQRLGNVPIGEVR